QRRGSPRARTSRSPVRGPTGGSERVRPSPPGIGWDGDREHQANRPCRRRERGCDGTQAQRRLERGHPEDEMSADLEDPTVDEGTRRAWSIHAGRVITDSTELRNTISEGDLPTAFQAAAHKAPHISALRIGSSEITHGELDHRVGVVASTLHRVGLGADHVALLAAPTSIEFVIGYLACLRVGAAVAVASPTTTRAEREKIWRASGASFVVGTGEGLDDLP